ncbi:hypothetical protein [Oscillibacter sp. GMB15532]|uniref:hypothetical protein n=1 Tax=Oscillibacter sp. GMB15532 TaxID=3230022 RepID=UPI0034DFEE54
MGNGEKLTTEEFEKIESLVQRAVNASNKKEAKPFIDRLNFMKNTLTMQPYERIVYSELVSYTTAASGQVRDKQHWLNAVNQSLYKLKPLYGEGDPQ